MKKIIQESFKELFADKYLLVLVIFLIMLSLIFSIIIGFSIQPSERQLISHYSAFGNTQFYSDQWSYLIVFVAFEIISAIIHSLIAVKILIIKGHSLATMAAWLGIGIVSLGFITALAVINVWISL